MPRFTPDFLDELRARFRASDVIGRHVKLKKEGREYRGLSPFTNEKTPSFFVNDEKGRYYDFSSNKSGDIISFLMDAQKLSFVEAVTELAERAGMTLPTESPAERQRTEKAKTLAEACTEAARFYRSLLSRRDGEVAAAYLDRRGVDQASRDRFGLGYAPESRTALKDHLLNKDFPLGVLTEAGLLVAPEDGGAPFDRFRHRLMFPILGLRGEVIAFGGRALSSGAKAKYLNSPETPLFHKSHTLYNLSAARRQAAKSGRPLVVAEGYMDVIAIARAGLPAVAPLGTALTEQQIRLLWRTEGTPILCFDGDRAGRAAAYRAIDRALPLLEPGRSLDFVFLPDGQDPDDIVRAEGPAAFVQHVGETVPLAELLWQRERDANPGRTPETEARFRSQLRQLVGTITDADVRRAYGDFFAARFAQARPTGGAEMARGGGPRAGNRRGSWRPPFTPPPVSASPALQSRLAGADKDQLRLIEAVLCLGLIHHPQLFEAHEQEILRLAPSDPGLGSLWRRTIDALLSSPDLDSEGLTSHILKDSAAGQTYQYWMRHPHVQLERFIRAGAPQDLVDRGWSSALSKYIYFSDLEQEVADAAAEAHKGEGQEKMWRAAVSHRSRLGHGASWDEGDEEA
jgi:DNA primase